MKKLSYIIIALMYMLSSNAQVKLPEYCQVALPKVINSELITDKDVKQLIQSSDWRQSDKTNHYWIVYSDRENNVTYNKPDKSSGRFDILNFNEELRIAKLQNGFALVYKEEKTNSVYPKINKGISRGWVPMTHLLLWNSCPTNDLGIYHKAFLVDNTPVIKDPSQKLITDTEIYFVMKEDSETGLVLLSRHSDLIGTTLSHALYGWVDRASFIPWDQRLCLEPNWNLEVTEKIMGYKIPIYHNGIKIKDVEIGRVNNLRQKRLSPDEMRFPVLKNSTGKENQYSILAFGDIDGQKVGFLGYTDKTEPYTGENYWNPVIYISENEFKDLMSNLQGVMTAVSSGSEDRRPYVNAMKTLVRTMIPDITEAQMQQKGNKEIMAMVAGLNVSSDALRGRTLEEIQNKNIVSNEEFINLIMNFEDKFNKLDQMRTSEYEYSIMRNGTRWFWIPVSDLP